MCFICLLDNILFFLFIIVLMFFVKDCILFNKFILFSIFLIVLFFIFLNIVIFFFIEVLKIYGC